MKGMKGCVSKKEMGKALKKSEMKDKKEDLKMHEKMDSKQMVKLKKKAAKAMVRKKK